MPWREVSVMDQRREFVRLAMQEGVNRRELCRRFGISPDVGYKWLARQRAGDAELANRPRRTGSSAFADDDSSGCASDSNFRQLENPSPSSNNIRE